MTVESFVLVEVGCCRSRHLGGEDFGGCGLGCRARWDAFLAPMRVPAGGGGHGCGVERQDVARLSRTATPRPSAASRWRAITMPAAVAISTTRPPIGWETTTAAPANSGAPSSGCRGRTPTPAGRRCRPRGSPPGMAAVPWPAVRPRQPPRPRSVRRRWPVTGCPPQRGEPVQAGLCFLDGQLIGQGAPPPLGGGVLTFSTTPLRFAAPGGQIATDTP